MGRCSGKLILDTEGGVFGHKYVIISTENNELWTYITLVCTGGLP